MRDERRKEERSKQDQTNNKAKQHSTPKAVTVPEKNELPRVGLYATIIIILAIALKYNCFPGLYKIISQNHPTIFIRVSHKIS